ncbi:MAG: hypothetical protein WBG90_08425 [Saonia sp.]
MKEFVKDLLRPHYVNYRQNKKRRRFKKTVASSSDLKIVVGSSGVYQDGWIPSEVYFLNLLDENNWTTYFKENSINNIAAEHVWEHLTLEEGKTAAINCYKFLKKSGRLRVAVPDGFHRSEDYIDKVKPGGTGNGAHDHKVLYNYKTLGAIFSEVGFRVELLEYFNENNEFQAKEWDGKDGFVRRSSKHDKRNYDGALNYTSLIVDAIKQ